MIEFEEYKTKLNAAKPVLEHLGIALKLRGSSDAFGLGPCMLLGAVLAPLVV